MRRRVVGIIVVTAVFAGLHLAGACTRSLAPAPLPERLAATGLYADIGARTLAAGVMPYTPQYPLWSDGARKERWFWLPPGTTIDATDPDRWVFPVGTRQWKEFAFERRIETRFAERLADGSWRYATYRWTADETDAWLVPEEGVRAACESAPGVPYDIPSRADCRACHATGGNAVLGLSALQLSADRDPHAPHAELPAPGSVDLAGLRQRGLLQPPLPDDAPRIAARTPRERAALGYLHANCGICHHADGNLAALGMVLAHDLGAAAGHAPAVATTSGRAAAYRAGAVRVQPGAAADSLLVQRAATDSPLLRMPPLGTRRADAQALDLIRAWIDCDLAPGPILTTDNR